MTPDQIRFLAIGGAAMIALYGLIMVVIIAVVFGSEIRAMQRRQREREIARSEIFARLARYREDAP